MKKVKFIKNHFSGIKKDAEHTLADHHADRLIEAGYAEELIDDTAEITDPPIEEITDSTVIEIVDPPAAEITDPPIVVPGKKKRG